MGLPSDLVNKLVKVTHDRGQGNTNFTVYGTVTTDGTRNYVKIDGSDISTPIESTVEISEGDRVRVEVKNHIATATGNITDPSIGTKTANGLRSEISQTAAQIRLEVANEVAGLNSSLTLTASDIRGEVNDKVNGLNSTISQTATDIRAEVADEVKGLNAKINVNAEGISSVVTKQNEFSEFKQTFDTFEFINEDGKVKISSGNLQLTGAISFGDLSGTEGVLSDIAAAKSAADSAQSTADDAASDASSAKVTANSAKTKANAVDTTLTKLLDEDDTTTYIDGSKIVTESLYVDKIKLGEDMTVYKKLSGTTAGGYFGWSSGWNSTRGIGMWADTAVKEGQCVCTNEAARISYGSRPQVITSKDGNITLDASGTVYLERNGTVVAQTYNDGKNNMFIPGSDSAIYLGRTSNYWIAVYSDNYYGGTANATGSDRNLKNSIEDLPDKYVEMFDQLRPVRYKLNNGTSDRYHVGYIAQEVEEAMTTAGIDSQEFGGLVKDKNEDGTYTYMLRYGEFDAIRDAKIKQLEARVAALEER